MDNDNRQLLFFPQQPGMRHPAQAAFTSFCAVCDALPNDRIIDRPTEDRLEELRMMTKAAYELAPEWATMRKRKAINQNVDEHGMNLHHFNYDRARGCERYGDFVLLTPEQHRYVHGRAA